MHSLSGYSTTDRIKPSGYSSLLFRWLFHNAFILKVAQRMGMKIHSYTLSHNNHKQVPSRQVPLHKREDDERVWLSWNNWMTRKLFHITNSSVIFGCLVCLVCYQPISPSYLVVLSISNRNGHISAGIFETMLASYVIQVCWK